MPFRLRASAIPAATEAVPGSILASKIVKDLTVGSGLNFSFLGRRELKGIPESWEIYALAS